MNVIVAGSRGIGPSAMPREARPFTSGEIADIRLVLDTIEESGFYVTGIISGCAKGVDTTALLKPWACPVKKMPAEWKRLGKSAGFARNIHMSLVGEALVAIWDGESRGTGHMIGVAEGRGMPVYVKENIPNIPRPCLCSKQYTYCSQNDDCLYTTIRR